MPTQAYERYGLTGNPFRDLAAENLEDVEIFHVNQEVDETLRTIREDVFDKENHACVAVTGPLGAGKTERLLVAAAEARTHHAFTVYFDVSSKTEWVLRGLATEVRKAAEAAKLAKTFGAPPWLRAIGGLEKTRAAEYDPKSAGRAIAAALNERAPSVLLLNDLHNLADKQEVDSFVDVLHEIADAVRPGVLVMFSAYASYLAWLTTYHPAFASRINRSFLLASLSNDEAALVVAKKMLAKRVVEDLDPTFPFDGAAVKALNKAASGNPRRLLEYADLALEYGVAHRSYGIDVDIVEAVLEERQKPAPRAEEPGTESSPRELASPSIVAPTPRKGSGSSSTRPPWSESP